MIVSRIAPTPSGFLHIGNIFSFLYTWLLCRKHDGKLWLRIDDIDAERTRPEYLADIFDSLDWLGISYDWGPKNVQEFQQEYSQQLRLVAYNGLLSQLRETGYVFGCQCSRAKIKELSANGLYPKICRGRVAGHDTEEAWRIAVPDAPVIIEDKKLGQLPVNLAQEMGDFVVRRKGGLPSYQIASLYEDTQAHINLIVRGQDLLSSTAAQLYLADLLKINTFRQATFIHHPLIIDAQGQKLSKSDGAPSVRQMRLAGKKPAAIYRMAAQWLGLSEADDLETLLAAFVAYT